LFSNGGTAGCQERKNQKKVRKTMEIPSILVQALVDAAYKLAVANHYEDIPEEGVELPVIDVLRRFKQLGVEPTRYSSDGDPDLLLGKPLWANREHQRSTRGL
jgi:hypothetical protein